MEVSVHGIGKGRKDLLSQRNLITAKDVLQFVHDKPNAVPPIPLKLWKNLIEACKTQLPNFKPKIIEKKSLFTQYTVEKTNWKGKQVMVPIYENKEIILVKGTIDCIQFEIYGRINVVLVIRETYVMERNLFTILYYNVHTLPELKIEVEEKLPFVNESMELISNDMRLWKRIPVKASRKHDSVVSTGTVKDIDPLLLQYSLDQHSWIGKEVYVPVQNESKVVNVKGIIQNIWVQPYGRLGVVILLNEDYVVDRNIFTVARYNPELPDLETTDAEEFENIPSLKHLIDNVSADLRIWKLCPPSNIV